MNQEEKERFLRTLQNEISPALGCTEPVAAALCAAGAASRLPGRPERITLEASEYILKNAMNVGIPGTSSVGLATACALGAAVADPEKRLLVLEGMTQEQKDFAKSLVDQDRVTVSKADTSEKVYLKATASAGDHWGEAVISGSHGNFTRLSEDGTVIFDKKKDASAGAVETEDRDFLTVKGIWDFISSVEEKELSFLEETVEMNSSIAEEGLRQKYGLQVGKSVLAGTKSGILEGGLSSKAVAVTAAAADARMSGCERTVMSVAGSGNQGLTATLPIIAVAEDDPDISHGEMLKALAMSILVTVHAKHFIGRLSVLCGCSIAAAIGVVSGMVYLFGGTRAQAELGIKTMTADISGMICDGAKPGCALKIATSVSAAMRAVSMALSGLGANNHDGIVDQDVELTLKNLGELGTEGMSNTNMVILDMLLKKQHASE